MRRLAAMAMAVVLTGTACGSTVEGRAIPGDIAPPTPPTPTTTQPPVVPDGFEETPEVVIEPGTPGGEFTVAAFNPISLKPADAAYGADALFVGSVFTPLTTLATDLQAQPGAAERWETDAACKEWTFSLNRNGRFHNGDPVTAESFVKGWKAVTKGTASRLLAGVDGYPQVEQGLKAVDDRTLRVTLSKPDCEFALRAASPALVPLPEADAPDDQPIGNGPFTVERASASGGADLVRWDDYALADKAYLDSVHIKFVAPEAAMTGAAAGEFDWVEGEGNSLRSAREQHAPKGNWISRAEPGFNGLQATAKGPLKSADARKAISMAIDRERVSETALDGRFPAAGTMLSGFPTLPSAQLCGACQFDPSKAKALAKKAGFDSKTKLNILVGEHGDNVDWAKVVANSIEKTLDINVQVTPMPFDRLMDKAKAGDPGLYRMGWLPDVPSPADILAPLLSSDGIKNGSNYARYSDDKFDKLLATAASTDDESSRTALYREAEQYALDTDMPVIPIVSYREFRIVNNTEFKNLRMDFWGNPDLRVISQR